MKLRFSTHAQIRFQERGIDVEKVKQTISKPDNLKVEPEGRFRATKLFGDRAITVIYTKERNTFVIITTI